MPPPEPYTPKRSNYQEEKVVLQERNIANKENIPARPAPRTPKKIADAWDELVINQTPERPRAWTDDNYNSPSM